MPDEIDLQEDVFTLQASYRVPVGCCAILAGRKLVYTGRVERMPEPQSSWVVFLHPDDFEELDKIYRKAMN